MRRRREGIIKVFSSSVSYAFAPVCCSTYCPMTYATVAHAPPRVRVSVPEMNQWVAENMDLTQPMMKRTQAVTAQAEVKRASSGRSGKQRGIMT